MSYEAVEGMGNWWVRDNADGKRLIAMCARKHEAELLCNAANAREQNDAMLARCERYRGITEQAAAIFRGVEDMQDLDAADFKDRAGEFWRLIVTARAALKEDQP